MGTVTYSRRFTFYTLLLKQHFVVTQTVCQAEIPALLDSWVMNAPSVKMLCPEQIASLCIFVKA